MAVAFNFTKEGLGKLPIPDKRTYYQDTREPRLGLYVTPSGVKTYFARLTIQGKTRRIPIGRFPDLSVPLARDKATKAAAEVAQGIDPVQEKRTRKAFSRSLRDVFEDFLRERDLKPGTVADYRRAVEYGWGEWLDRPLASLTETKVLRRYRERGRASKARADVERRVLSAVFNFARARYKDSEGHSLFPQNPVEIVCATKTRYKIGRKRRVIRRDQFPAWWEAVHALKSPEARDWFLMALFLGMRKSEVSALRWEDVDMDACLVRVLDTKNRRPVELPLPQYVADLLRARRGRKRTGWVFPAGSKAGSGHIDSPTTSIREVRKASGVDFSPHDLRRVFISVANGLDINHYTVKFLVNHVHDESDVTAGYDVPDFDRLRAASDRIARELLNRAGVDTGKVIEIGAARQSA
jgi:integrase